MIRHGNRRIVSLSPHVGLARQPVKPFFFAQLPIGNVHALHRQVEDDACVRDIPQRVRAPFLCELPVHLLRQVVIEPHLLLVWRVHLSDLSDLFLPVFSCSVYSISPPLHFIAHLFYSRHCTNTVLVTLQPQDVESLIIALLQKGREFAWGCTTTHTISTRK